MFRAVSSVVLSGAMSMSISLLASNANADEPKPMTKEQVEMIVYNALMTSAGAIDVCTTAYLQEYPNANGKVTLEAVLAKDGTVGQATATLSLEGARNLRPCLERVARTWRLPPPPNAGEKLTVSVPIKKGTKFTLRKPGEKPPENKAQAAETEPEGFIQFLPGGWNESSQ